MANQKGLGRGLDVLFGSSVPDLEEGDVFVEVALDEVTPNPDQPRRTFNEEELDDLAESIRENGLLQPIVCRRLDGHYQIVAGERRWQAARRAGLDRIQIIVRDIDDRQLLRLALIENLQRSDLTPIEEARGIAALMEQESLTQQQAALAISKSRSAITNVLRLLDLPDEVQEMISTGQLSAGHGRAILAAEGDEARIALAKHVVANRLSVRQTENLAPRFSVKDERKQPEPASDKTNSFSAAAASLKESLGTKVAVRTVRGHHRIEIEFANEEELSALVERILNTRRNGEGEVIG